MKLRRAPHELKLVVTLARQGARPGPSEQQGRRRGARSEHGTFRAAGEEERRKREGPVFAPRDAHAEVRPGE